MRFAQVFQPQAVSLPHGLTQGGGNPKHQGVHGVPFPFVSLGGAVTRFAVL